MPALKELKVYGGTQAQTMTTQCSRFTEQSYVSSIMKLQSKCNCIMSEGAKEMEGQGTHNRSFKSNYQL